MAITQLSHRQEKFCQLVKQGINPHKAYPMAGYSYNRGSPYRLHDNARIKRRLKELTRALAVKTRVTIESLTDEFNRAIALAERVENPGAITQAAVAKGKLHGLIVDRKESGQPGEFAGLTTPDEVLALVAKELGAETAKVLAAALERDTNALDVPALDASRDDTDAIN